MKNRQSRKTERFSERRYGSDFIVDVLRHYDIPYAAFNPGASFRGIHDSLVNYLGNQTPELIECTHEEISVAIAQGYARASGKPMVAILHNVVGLQHATMAIYNAWCDRAPVILLGGTGPMSYVHRRPGSDWVHTALVQGNLIRDFVKWDDQPSDLESVPESFARAYQTAMTEPTGPVYICYDAEMQEQQFDRFPELPAIKNFQPPSVPTASPKVLQGVAHRLLEADNPVIVADRLGRSAVAYDALVQLADLLSVPVLDQGNRHSFPTSHPMALGDVAAEVIADADFILGLDVLDFYAALHQVDRITRETVPMYPDTARIAHVTLNNYLLGSWSHDFRRLQPMDDSIAADIEVFVPQLLERCQRMVQESEFAGGASKRIQARTDKWVDRVTDLRTQWRAQADAQRSEQPIARSTLALSVWNVIKDEPWVLANGIASGWAKRIWNIEKYNQYLGKNTGGGVGYGIGAVIGAALAYPDRLCVNLQNDGDLLYTSSGLWTAAHHKIPILSIVVNNRSYYNSEEHGAKIAAHRGRPVENAPIGTRLEDPAVDFATLAESMGVYGEGPIVRSEDIEPAVQRALRVVKTERRPALVDVIVQNR